MKPTAVLNRCWPALLIGGAWLWMFWPMMSGQTVCGFRDSAYLYYPLFKWIDSVWAGGEIPLWNPYCNYGLSVVGDGSSSVFYPGKLIFLCRFLSFPSRYGIYLAAHVLLAATGAYTLARTMKANRAGATLAGASYAFGGSVLFQVTNVIFLVSAAWLPFALVSVWRGVIRNDLRFAVAAGVVCGLMILGGDPQMVYHVGLIAAVSVASQTVRLWRRLSRVQPKRTRFSCQWFGQATWRLALMVAVTSGLAAIQILPTTHWVARSERAMRYETNLQQTMANEIFTAPQRGTQKDATYQFSQPPWSVFELVFPNVLGKPFPTHQRWSDRLPGAERIWTPTLYAGLLPFLFAIPMLRLWGRHRKTVWLTRVGLFFAIGSCGWFGAVWLINELLAASSLPTLTQQANLGPQVGGVYWVMETFLPRYFLFRYPAKLFVIASLMLSVLAGIGLTRRPTIDRRAAIGLAVLCVASLIVIQLPSVQSAFKNTPANMLFGPLDVSGVNASLSHAFLQPFVLLVMVVALPKLIPPIRSQRSALAWLIVILTTFDLLIANGWLKAEIDASTFEQPTAIGAKLDELKSTTDEPTPIVYRNFNVQSKHPAWIRETSEDRLAEIVTWQRETLFPKHQLEHQIALFGSFGSVWPAEYRPITGLLQLQDRELGTVDPRALGGRPFSARITHNEQMLTPLEQTEETPTARFSIRRAYDQSAKLRVLDSKPVQLGSGTVAISVDVPPDSGQATLHYSGVLADDGWRARVEDLSTNKILSAPVTARGFELMTTLDPGRYRVTFTYSPREFWAGMWVSLGSLVVLSIFGVAFYGRRKR